jgi:hypothetical protein
MPAPATHRSVMLPCHCLQWGGVLAVLLLAGCGKKESAPDANVLAQGDGWSVRADDFRHWWSTRPGPADSPQARTEALDRLVERATLAAAARQAGLERDPETVAQIESLLIARLQEVRLAPQLAAVKVSDEEVRARYDAQRESAFTRPEAVRVALLWFNTRGQQPLVDRYRPRLEQIRAEVSAGGDQFPVAAGFGPPPSATPSTGPPASSAATSAGWNSAPAATLGTRAVLDARRPAAKPGRPQRNRGGQGRPLPRAPDRAPVRRAEALRSRQRGNPQRPRRGAAQAAAGGIHPPHHFPSTARAFPRHARDPREPADPGRSRVAAIARRSPGSGTFKT